MVDLQVALQNGWKDAAISRLDYLSTSLGSELYEKFFPGVEELRKQDKVDLAVLKMQVAAGSAQVIEQEKYLDGFLAGSCLRAALLAIESHNEEFFRDRKTRAVCELEVDTAAWNPKSREQLENLFYDRDVP